MSVMGQAFLAGASDVIEAIANVLGAVLGVFTMAGLVYMYVHLIRSKKKFGLPEYVYIGALIAGFAILLVLLTVLRAKK
jgi:amino acid transporter